MNNGKYSAGRLQLISLFAVNALGYALTAAYNNFAPLYITGIHGSIKAGILLSIGPIVSIFAPMFWGVCADKAKYKNTILLILAVGTGLSYYTLTFSENFFYQGAILAVVMFFLSALPGILDTITIDFTTKARIAYGPPRIMGTLAYGIISLGLSMFISDDMSPVFVIMLALMLFTVLSSLTMPHISGYAHNRGKISLLPLFKNGRFMIYILMIFIMQFAWAYYQNCFPTYLADTLGMPSWVWGLNILITVLGEIPLFLLFPRMYRKFGSIALLGASLVGTIVRCLGFFFLTSALGILGIGFVTGAFITLATYAVSFYINDNIEPERRASAQTLVYGIGVGTAKALAGIIGGFMTEGLGCPLTFLIFAGAEAAGLAALVLFNSKKGSLNAAK